MGCFVVAEFLLTSGEMGKQGGNPAFHSIDRRTLWIRRSAAKLALTTEETCVLMVTSASSMIPTQGCPNVLTAMDQKLQKHHKKVILLSITLTFRRRDGG